MSFLSAATFMYRMPALICLGAVILTMWIPAADTTGWVPLNTLGSRMFQGFMGGLYADGRNEPWGAHAEALQKMSAAIRPLDQHGQPDANGKIVIIGIGASVCVQIFKMLEELAPPTPGIAAHVVFQNCARGGHDVNKISDPERRYWEWAKATLEKAGLSPAQVQVAWYQSDELIDRRTDFPGRPQRLKDAIARNLREARQHFPNLRICYHSARHTTAFSPDTGVKDKHGEPRSYHVGWAVKWLIEEQASGKDDLRFDGPKAVAPLVAWATYFWTDADQPRHDGYQWTRDDVVKDGVHFSRTAQSRVAKELIDFWCNDPYAGGWFAAKPPKAR